MHKKVKAYLDAYSRLKNAQEQEKKHSVLISLGLYTIEDAEVSKEDGYDYVKRIDGEKHYFVRGQMVPVPVTDEEYEKILETLPENFGKERPEDEDFPDEDEENEEDDEEEEDDDLSPIAVVLFVVACLLWLGGAALSFLLANKLSPEGGFSLPVFFICLASAFLAGCFFWHASETQKKLSDIRTLLEKLSDRE